MESEEKTCGEGLFAKRPSPRPSPKTPINARSKLELPLDTITFPQGVVLADIPRGTRYPYRTAALM